MGHPRRRLSFPPQVLPIRLEEALGGHWDSIVSGFAEDYRPLLGIDPRARHDSGKSAEAKHLLDKARRRMEQKVGEARSRVEGLASEFAKRTSHYQRQQLARQAEAAMGISLLTMRDADVGRHLRDFVRDNVRYVTSIGQDQHEALEETVMDAIRSGTHHEVLRDAIHHRFGVSVRHARLIARDQTTKLYSRVNRERQKHLGLHRYVWATMMDERVRDSHADMEGQVCRFDDPPIVDGEPANPGEPVQCRCYSDPYFEDLLL